ncbi:MAG: PilN domain-containing protein [Pseudomonadota bacterium]
MERLQQWRTELRDRLAEFIAWWREALVATLPARVVHLFATPDDALVLVVDRDRASVEHRLDERRIEVRALESDAELGVVLDAMEGDTREYPLVVEVSEGEALRRTLRWPLQATTNLRTALSFEIEKLMPFPADAVYFGWRVERKLPAEGMVEFELVAVPRHLVDPWLERLRALVPAREPAALTVEGLDNRLDLLPEAPDRQRRIAGTTLAARYLAVAALVLLVLAAALPLYKKHRHQALLEAQVAVVQKEAEQVRVLKDSLDRRMAAMQQAAGEETAKVPRALVLEEIARLLPDTAYLQSMELKGRTLKLVGEAESSLSLVDGLKASPLFSRVDFSAPVSRRANADRERFQLEIQLRKAADKPADDDSHDPA